jgi:cobaltochelatase CobT
MEAVDAPAADMADDAEMGDSETAAEPWRPRIRGATSRAGRTIGPSRQVRRGRRRRGSVRPEELERLRGYLDKQLSHLCRAWWRGSPTGCSGG